MGTLENNLQENNIQAEKSILEKEEMVKQLSEHIKKLEKNNLDQENALATHLDNNSLIAKIESLESENNNLKDQIDIFKVQSDKSIEQKDAKIDSILEKFKEMENVENSGKINFE